MKQKPKATYTPIPMPAMTPEERERVYQYLDEYEIAMKRELLRRAIAELSDGKVH